MTETEIIGGDGWWKRLPLSRLYGLLAALAVLSAVTWLIGSVDQRRLSGNINEAQLVDVQDALDRVESEFRALQASMTTEARALAGNAELVRALRDVRGGDRAAEDEVVRMMAAYELPENGAVEIYDQQPRLIGWAGTSIPLDTAPSEVGFLDSYQSSLAFDGQQHSALVMWWPVRDGTEPVGAVRILRMIVRLVPVRNEFLRDYTLDEEWSRLTGMTVHVDLNPSYSFDPEDSRYTRVLHGSDGRALIHVRVDPPSAETLVAARRQRYADIQCGWMTLALLLLLVWAGRWTAPISPGESPVRPILRFMVFLVFTVASRLLFLEMNVPGRWQPGKAPLNPLFDPQHFASLYGGGIMRTSGDLLVTALFALVVSLLFLRSSEPARRRVSGKFPGTDGQARRYGRAITELRLFLSAAVHVLLVLGLLAFLARVSQHAVLDSTLDYFERSGLLPHRLVLLVFGSLLVLTVSVSLVCSRSVWSMALFAYSKSKPGISSGRVAVLGGAGGLLVLAGTYTLTDIASALRLDIAVVFLAFVYLLAYFGAFRRTGRTEWLHLRSVVPSVVLVSLLLYPILERGLEIDRRQQMEQAALSFEEEMDSRVMFAIRQVLARASESVLPFEASGSETVREARYDSLAGALTIGELISALGTHDISVTVFSADGTPLGRYEEVRRRGTRETLNASDADEFDLVRTMYMDREGGGPLIEKMTGDRDRFIYAGFAPVPSIVDVRGWVLVRATPHEIAREGAQAFPRVLVPSGYYGDHYQDMSLAEFQDGVMIRNFGRAFGRYSLASDVQARLRTSDTVWKDERIRERDYVTLYRRADSPTDVLEGRPGPGLGPRNRTIAVRLPTITFFDHLYFLLRITIAGLFVGIPLYLWGVAWRVRRGQLPARRVHFQDKVLNAFFVVGLVTVTVTGWVGWEVVTGENERAVESWLRQHLTRVEDTLVGDAHGEELSYRVLERTDLDSLSSRIGLDLNIYRGAELEKTSRPQLVRDRLIDPRLPVQAYKALFLDNFRFVSVDQSLGSFLYTAGYLALTDEQGVPKYVISLPTLPEQERIEEERARTVAYLFGALLLLVLVVMVTASLLANALARPIARLREGLVAVSAGHFESIGPIRSRDEIADLVDSFNTMQEQIVESRDLLARQERQLAWREMARQVAHEIKNPLTPMKLSIQHLRSAYTRMRPPASETPDEERELFETKFNRTTTTLIEQINALARIADGFSSFGRLPQTLREPLDVNLELEAAANLMRNESDISIESRLSREPLIIDGDKEAIRRLFINLIKNAIQAIPDDRDGIITLTSKRILRDDGADWAEACVADNGVGISESLQDKIFVPSFSTKTSGTGLGLAIARKTIEDLGGEIGFETEDGVGTTFRVLLRLRSD